MNTSSVIVDRSIRHHSSLALNSCKVAWWKRSRKLALAFLTSALPCKSGDRVSENEGWPLLTELTAGHFFLPRSFFQLLNFDCRFFVRWVFDERVVMIAFWRLLRTHHFQLLSLLSYLRFVDKGLLQVLLLWQFICFPFTFFWDNLLHCLGIKIVD